MRRDGATVAEISKRWFSLRDTHAVDVAPDENVALVLALTEADRRVLEAAQRYAEKSRGGTIGLTAVTLPPATARRA